jgi:predicted GNAT family N-acyltransferase
MQVRTIEHASPEYLLELELRNRLLRVPLGLDVFAEDLEAERGQWHYGLFDDGEFIGCVVALPAGDQTARIRQMAIDTSRQRSGLGRVLMEAVERDLAQRGIRRVILHARIEAVGFYGNLGYKPVGEDFVEVGIPHRGMEKVL